MAPDANSLDLLFAKPIAHRGLHDKSEAVFETR